MPATAAPMQLQPPVQRLTVESVSASPPGVHKIVAQDIAFELEGGQGLGVIGPSGSGKSSLARMLVGVWQPVRGKVRLDGAALDQWAPDALGRHIGYLPQDVELLAGTVAQNIARFEPEPDNEAVIAAAKAVGVHDMIVRLPSGYDTQIGEQGSALSAGQAQRIALARAVYRDPFLVVLDEPNSNLDSEGEEALTRAILGVRERKGIIVVVAHRPSAIAGVDRLLMMNQGERRPSDRKKKSCPRCCNGPSPSRGRSRSFPTAGVAAHENAAHFKHQRALRRMGRAVPARGAVGQLARIHPPPLCWPAD